MISTACLILLQVSEFHFFSEKKGLKGKKGKKGKSRGARRRVRKAATGRNALPG
jgi:hypothetical protein